MIKILPYERWGEIEDALGRFGFSLPDPSSANILFKENNRANISTFAILETLIKVGQIHTIEKVNGNAPREILKYVLENVPKGSSVVALDDNERFSGLCRHFGMYHIPGKFYRRDF